MAESAIFLRGVGELGTYKCNFPSSGKQSEVCGKSWEAPFLAGAVEQEIYQSYLNLCYHSCTIDPSQG